MRALVGAARSKGGLVRKPTRWASSAPELSRRLGVKCSSEGRAPEGPRWRDHEPLVGQARAA
eukprot:7962693-Alexandrium_andersonii.AAC.1